MNDRVGIFIFLGWMGLMGLFVVALVVHSRKAAAASGERLRQLAGRLGLGLIEQAPVLGLFPRLPEIQGKRGDRWYRIYQYTTRQGKSSTTWVGLKAGTVAGTDLKLNLTRQGLGSKLRSVFGAREIAVGKRGFDDAWFIETNDPDFMRAALVEEVRAAIVASQPADRARGHYTLEEGEVFYREIGSFQRDDVGERFEHVFVAAQRLLDLAEVHVANGGRAPR